MGTDSNLATQRVGNVLQAHDTWAPSSGVLLGFRDCSADELVPASGSIIVVSDNGSHTIKFLARSQHGFWIPVSAIRGIRPDGDAHRFGAFFALWA